MDDDGLAQSEAELIRILGSGANNDELDVENDMRFVILNLYRIAYQQRWHERRLDQYFEYLMLWMRSAARHSVDHVPKEHVRRCIRTFEQVIASYGDRPRVVRMSSGIPHAYEPMQSPWSKFETIPAPIASPTLYKPGRDPAPALPTDEIRHLCGHAPVVVAVESSFEVSVVVDIERTSARASMLAPLAIPDAGLTVTLTAICGEDNQLQLQGHDSVEVLVLPGVASETVRFHLKAVELGMGLVIIRAFAQQRYIGDLELWIDVALEGAAGVREAKFEMRAKPPSVEDATLVVSFCKATMSYTFVLRGDRLVGEHKYEHRIDAEPVDIVTEVMGQLDELARNALGHSSEFIDAALVGIGIDLWTRLLPPELQSRMVKHWDQIGRLAILAKDELLPWELLFCAEKNSFLADHWLISRRNYGDPAPDRVGGGPTCYVLPHTAPQAASDEIAKLRKIFPSQRIWRKWTELEAGLRDAGMGMLHIAAHNSVKHDSAIGISLMLDEPFKLNMLSRYAQVDARMKKSPVVFLNACSSAAAATQWVGSNSWASRFLLAGAGVFIGSLWEIRDESAAIFATVFYEGARRGEPLGVCFSKARTAISTAGDPTRFAYTYFGDPDAILREE